MIVLRVVDSARLFIDLAGASSYRYNYIVNESYVSFKSNYDHIVKIAREMKSKISQSFRRRSRIYFETDVIVCTYKYKCALIHEIQITNQN